MSKLRSVSTAFWSDPFIEDLNANEKLLFLYLITNDKTNMLGVFEVSIKKMSYDTGLKNIEIENALKGFERLYKVKYVNNHIILVNFLKNQKFNLNMKKSALTTYENLPKELKVNDLKIDLTKVELSFETLCKAFGMVRKVEVEVETKVELETKEEIKIITPLANFTFLEFWSLYPTKVNKDKCETKFNKLSNLDKVKIKDTLKTFLSYKPFPEYNFPNPYTYLNQSRWNDEIKNGSKVILPSNNSNEEMVIYTSNVNSDQFTITRTAFEEMKKRNASGGYIYKEIIK